MAQHKRFNGKKGSARLALLPPPVDKRVVHGQSVNGDHHVRLSTGTGGQAAAGIAPLLGIAQSILDNSTAAEAKGFDAAQWLEKWTSLPQPALGGCRPAELLDTPTGIGAVARILGAIESGAFV